MVFMDVHNMIIVLLGNSMFEGHADLDGSLGGFNLVVGTDVLEDGLSARAVPLLEGLDGGGDHGGEGRVGGGGLGLGSGLLGLGGSSSGGRHDEELNAVAVRT